MEWPYLEWARIEKYRCIRSVDLHLTRLHALIGPNDSGKSSLLRALHTQRQGLWISNGMALGAGWGWGKYPAPPSGSGFPPETLSAAIACLFTAFLRLDPDDLRQPASLFAGNHSPWFCNERGLGLPALYDALLSRDIPAFLAISQRFTKLFPTVRALRMINPDDSHKTLGLTLTDGTEIGPEDMSEGMLYWLAFAVIAYLNPVGILLIEEPENGLHPLRIAEVMRILRDISKQTQVILATHSPLIINELQPEEVTIVTRTPERGTICTPMTETKNFAERSKVYALGELWLSYADGDLERELVGGGPSVSKSG